MRKNKNDRTAEIIDAALRQSVARGLHHMTMTSVASAIDVQRPVINYHIGGLRDLQQAVCDAAVFEREWRVVFDAHSVGCAVPDNVMRQACDALFN